MPCLDDNGILEFVDARLPPAAARAANAHIDGCKDCRKLVAELVRQRSLSGLPLANAEAQTLPSDDAQRRSPSALPQGTRVGRYVVRALLGQGGMGVVYAAHDPELNREIGLKLLRADETGERAATGRTRLLREAQVLAQLSHPNVVAVHDVGTWEDQVFVAMELVPEGTLARWLKEEQPTWRERFQVFLLAGRGLAAAHAAGLVHRDFKPDNVLVGRDGRVRVTDFGLACPEASERSPSTGDSPLLSELRTTAGALIGTPAYMAPEQLAGKDADARADQFAFCVALYEGLYGERPFAGDSVGSLGREVLAGRIRPPPRRSAVPSRVRRVLLKGLATDAAERFPSMEALLAELERDPSRTWRRWALVAVTAVAVIAAVSMGVRLDQRSRRCLNGPNPLAGAWDEEVRARLEEVFSRSPLPYAATAWRRTASLLDAYAADFAQQSRALCEESAATAVSVSRGACLDERRAELAAFTALLLRGEPAGIERAPLGAGKLTTLASCTRPPPLPPDEATRARLQAAGARLATVNGYLLVNDFTGMSVVEEVLAEARALGYRPLEARALSALSNFQERAGDPKSAEKTLHLAIQALQATRDDEGAAKAALGLFGVVGMLLQRPEEARLWAAYASAAVERAGSGPLLQGRLFHALGQFETEQGNRDVALRWQEQALQTLAKVLPADDPDMSQVYISAGLAFGNAGRWEEALALFRHALSNEEAAYGPEHPRCSASVQALATALLTLEDYEEGLPMVARAIRLREAYLGRDHFRVGILLGNRGVALNAIGRHEEALADFRQSEAILMKTFGPAHSRVASARENIARALVALGKPRQALVAAQSAMRIRLAAPPSPERAEGHDALGMVLAALGRHREAIAHHRKGLALSDAAIAEVHPYNAESFVSIGTSQLALGDAEGAVGSFRQALELRGKVVRSQTACAKIQVALARALLATRRDAGEAQLLLQQAIAQLSHAPAYDQASLLEARELLAKLASTGKAKVVADSAPAMH